MTLSIWNVEKVFSEVLTLSWVMNKRVGGSHGKKSGAPGKRTMTEKAWYQNECGLRNVDNMSKDLPPIQVYEC